jgi:hypothetical protein
MAMIQQCVLCKKKGIIRDKNRGICSICVQEIVKAEAQRKRRVASDKKRGIHRYD